MRSTQSTVNPYFLFGFWQGFLQMGNSLDRHSPSKQQFRAFLALELVSPSFQHWSRSQLEQGVSKSSKGLSPEHFGSVASEPQETSGTGSVQLQGIISSKTTGSQMETEEPTLFVSHWVETRKKRSVSGVGQVGKIKNPRGWQVNMQVKKARIQAAGFKSQLHSWLIMESWATC